MRISAKMIVNDTLCSEDITAAHPVIILKSAYANVALFDQDQAGNYCA